MTQTNPSDAPKESVFRDFIFKDSVFGIISMILGLIELIDVLVWNSNICRPPQATAALCLAVPGGIIFGLIGRSRDRKKIFSSVGLAATILFLLCSSLSMLYYIGNPDCF